MTSGKPMVILEDQTLREGLQAEQKILDLEDKLRLFKMLLKAGLKRMQVGSFVHPARLPQMADSDILIQELNRQGPYKVLLSALVLNARGLDRALSSGVSHVTLSASLSDHHSRKNTGQSAKSALADITGLVRRANRAGLMLSAGLQCVFGSVYEGRIALKKILAAAEGLIKAGAGKINLADTTGMANPRSVKEVVARIQEQFPGIGLSLHLHDTRGLGLANMYSGYTAGVRHFDVCAGGLGGCPFLQGAAGNIPTEDAVNMFESMNIDTGIDLGAVCDIVDWLETLLKRPLPGHMQNVLARQRRFRRET